ncbi:hypothetical protein BCV64_02840 [Cylindrospermopsis raciborskii MVCC14]|nr:hypothetical protein BCV64_02840 [Cylindrospermopsis raciborskii MVCC14]
MDWFVISYYYLGSPQPPLKRGANSFGLVCNKLLLFGIPPTPLKRGLILLCWFVISYYYLGSSQPPFLRGLILLS